MHHRERIGNFFIPVHGCPRLLPTSAHPEAILAMNIDYERIVLNISEEHHAYIVKTTIFALIADDSQESSKVAATTLSPFKHPRTPCDGLIFVHGICKSVDLVEMVIKDSFMKLDELQFYVLCARELPLVLCHNGIPVLS